LKKPEPSVPLPFRPPETRRFPVTAFLALFFVSCATAPRVAEVLPGSADFSVLPGGASVYLWADVKETRPLLEALSIGGLDGSGAAEILERTDSAAAAFYPEGAGRRFFLAGWGSYPPLRAGISMTFSRDWKKLKSPTGKRYWYSQSSRIGAAVGSKLAYAADGDPFAASDGAAEIPGGFEEFRRGCVLAGWIPEPREPINRFAAAAEIPIQFPAEAFFFGAARARGSGDAWEMVFRIRTPSAVQARALTALFAMARIFITGQADGGNSAEFLPELFANPPVQEEQDIIFRSAVMDTEKTALLFNTFAVYFNQVK
jgi:hypothetical protein